MHAHTHTHTLGGLSDAQEPRGRTQHKLNGI